MSPLELGLLCGGGLVAGVVNTLAGGGSLLTVPLLVAFGLPGTLANGTNRIGVLVQNAAAVWSFRREGVEGLREALPVLVPVLAGSLVGAGVASRLDDAAFERLFAGVMVALLVPTLRGTAAGRRDGARPWPPWLRLLVFAGIGLYGGSIQAGVGLFLVLALARCGLDLVHANAVKVVIVGALTAVAVPVFLLEGQVAWAPALALASGTLAGGILGARVAVVGGERVIRPLLAAAVLALAGKMLGLY